MGKIATLKKNYEFNRVYKRGKRLGARSLSLHWLPRAGQQENRVGYAVARSHGGGVRRNHLKRLLREAYRSVDEACLQGYDLVLTARAPETLPTYAQVRRDLRFLLHRAGILPPANETGETALDKGPDIADDEDKNSPTGDEPC